MSQCERLEHYIRHRPITPLDAWEKLGIYRLASRIHDLKKQGLRIHTEVVEVANQYGETCKVAQYSMGAQ